MTQVRRLLSIDGGGVKVLSALVLLEELEKSLKTTGKTLLDVFDVFCGTSAGALVIAALVYAEMTASEIREHFFSKHALDRMMPYSILNRLDFMQMNCKFDGIGKRQMINEIIKPDWRLRGTTKVVIITAYDTYEKRPIVFSSERDDVSAILLRDLLDGASAAPGYFPLVHSTSLGRPMRLVDGAVFANNPTMIGYTELNDIYKQTLDTVRILSLGTGKHTLKRPVDDVHRPNEDYHPRNRQPIRDNSGGFPWVLEGDLMSIVYESPQDIIDAEINAWVSDLKDQYIRVNGHLPNNRLDDTSETNIKALEERGRTWWEENQVSIWAYIVMVNENLTYRRDEVDFSDDDSDDDDSDNDEDDDDSTVETPDSPESEIEEDEAPNEEENHA